MPYYRVPRLGAELKVGDTIDFLGQLKTITHFEPHNGLTLEGIHFPARVAMAGDGWGITVFDDENYTVLNVQTPHQRATCQCDRCRLWRTFLASSEHWCANWASWRLPSPLVQARALLLTDSADRLVPLGTARRLATTLSNARLHPAEGAGHHLPSEPWTPLPMRSWPP